MSKNQLQAAFTAAAVNLKRLAKALADFNQHSVNVLFSLFSLLFSGSSEFFNTILPQQIMVRFRTLATQRIIYDAVAKAGKKSTTLT
jgi:hypothetical protein